MSSTGRTGPSRRTRVREHSQGPTGALTRDREDRLATEEPLEVRCSWPGSPARRVAVTMRTPGHDFELAAGLVFTEGILGRREDLHAVAYCTDAASAPDEQYNVVTVDLAVPAAREPVPRYDGPAAATSACGVCGAQSIDDVLDRLRTPATPATPAPAGPVVDAAVLHRLPARLREAQRVFARTGGLHAAGLFDPAGTLLVAREDIGRHNAVDKVVGSRVLGGAGPDRAGSILLVSGRIGFEIAHKAAAAGIGVLAAVGAPSSLAVELADRAGICTVGFLGPERFVVYSHPEAVTA